MKRAGLVIALIAMVPLLMGGGMNPGCTNPNGCPVKLTGPALSGVLVVDPHMEGLTFVYAPADPGQKAKYAAIWLKKGTNSAGAIFRLPITFALSLGCNPSFTEQRFGVSGGAGPGGHYNGLRAWMPPSTVDELMRELGIDPSTAGEPVISDFNSVRCSWDSENPTPVQNGGGILSADIVIQFVK